MTQSELPQELRDKVAAELESGERIEWIGQPIAQLFSIQSMTVFGLGIFILLFTMLLVAAGSNLPPEENLQNIINNPSVAFNLFGIPFYLAGLLLVSAPYWMRRAALKTVYVITDRRAIAIEGGFRSMTLRVYRPDQLSVMTRKERSGGRGDIILSELSWRDSDGDPRRYQYGFINIPNVIDAYKKLEQLAQSREVRSKEHDRM